MTEVHHDEVVRQGRLHATSSPAIRSLGNSSAQVTVDNFFQAAMPALKALQDPAVLDLCEHSDFDVEEFLATRSTLYIIAMVIVSVEF